MGESMTRILVKTMVRKTIRDIKDSPERSIRNLVDMALNFSEGRFQQDFFRCLLHISTHTELQIFSF